jgi:hypothetical protein
LLQDISQIDPLPRQPVRNQAPDSGKMKLDRSVLTPAKE